MKAKSRPSSKKDHQHSHTGGKHANPLAHFFECCLGQEPASLSPKIQSIRENLQLDQLESVDIQAGQPFIVSKDMIIGDLLDNFPIVRDYFQELHPLGLMSPALHAISLEIFVADLVVNPDQICQELNSIINQSSSPNA